MQHDIHTAMVYFARDGSLYDWPVTVAGGGRIPRAG